MDIVESIATFWANVIAVWGIVPMIDAGLAWKTVAHVVGVFVVVKLAEDHV